ncbi:LexA family protein [Desertimonas flava]|uniref:LexA family protein n=1 Tax=Desertimonas flava TaxID=2064846 RepID=UPI0013C5213E|nr:hypothetical protein [Desertimonas flava]
MQAVDRRVLSFIAEHLAGYGYAPTLREIATACGLRGVSMARSSIARLVAAGALDQQRGQARGLTLPVPASDDQTAFIRRRDVERESLAVLELFALMEQGYYPYLCRAAALAPDLATAQDWLELVHARIRQLSALQDALLRARGDFDREITTRASRHAAAAWSALRRHCEAVSSWEGWLAIEQYETDVILARRFPTCDVAAAGIAAVVLEGNLDTARLGRAVVERALARGSVRDPQLVVRVARERARIEAVYADIGPLLDDIWPATPPPSTAGLTAIPPRSGAA